MSVHDWTAAIGYELTKKTPSARVDTAHLHNLLYICQGWHLSFTGRTGFDEPIVAYFNGAQIPDLTEVHGDAATGKSWSLGHPDGVKSKLLLIQDIVKSYGAMSTEVLRGKVRHQPPWMDAWEAADYGRSPAQEIPVDSIREFFREEEARTRRHHELKERLVWIETVEAERQDWSPHT